MINFKKVVSMIVVFSFVLCSCGNKNPLERCKSCSKLKANNVGNGSNKCKEEEKIEGCSDEMKSLFSLNEDKDLLNGLCELDHSNCIVGTVCGKQCNKEKKNTDKKCVKECDKEKEKTPAYVACSRVCNDKQGTSDEDKKMCLDTCRKSLTCNRDCDKEKEASTKVRDKCIVTCKSIDPQTEKLAEDVERCNYESLTCRDGINKLFEPKFGEKLKTMKGEFVTSDGSNTPPESAQLSAVEKVLEKAFKGKREYLVYKHEEKVNELAKQALTGGMSSEKVLEKVDEIIKELSKAVKIIEEKAKFDGEVMVDGKVALVYFFKGKDCPNCEKFVHTANALASMYEDTDVRVYKVDADVEKNKTLVEKYKVEVNDYPTLLLFENKNYTKISPTSFVNIDYLEELIDEARSR